MTDQMENLGKKTFEIDKYYKKVDSGFTFFSYISQTKGIIIGNIELDPMIENSNYKKDQTENFQFKKAESAITQDLIDDQNVQTFEYVNEKDKDKFFPVHVSCSKNSVAILVRENVESKRNDDEFKEYADFLTQIKESLKEKNRTFQNFFFKELSKERLISGSSEGKYFINDIDFKEKVSELIHITDKNQSTVNYFIEKVKGRSNMNGKVDLLLFYNIVYSVECVLTKISLFGNIINILEEEMDTNIKKFCRKNYGLEYIYDIPLITLPVKQIEIGDEHVLLLVFDGNVYAWGDSFKGACGTGKNEMISKPKRVKFPFKNIEIIKIACGSRHSLALDSNYCVYSWGQGKYGCLGHGNEHDYNKPKLIDAISNNKIEHISGGDNYSAAVSNQNQLFTWGSGEFGRLGHLENNDELLPKRVEDIKEQIIQVRCGYYCLIAYTAKKEIIAIGAKALFVKNQAELIKPELPSLKNIKDIRKLEIPQTPNRVVEILDCVCGYQFLCLFLEEKNIVTNHGKFQSTKPLDQMKEKVKKIFIWGNIKLSSSKFTQNFIEKPNYLKNELKINNNLAGEKNSSHEEADGVAKVICSDNNTAVLTKHGLLYVFGSYLYGVATKRIDQIYYPVALRGKIVKKISLGANHILVLTANFEVFGWGKNDCGQLGLGNAHNFHEVPVPLDKIRNKGIKSIKCAENYSACLTYTFEIILFGDISFIENSQFINYQLSPKTMDWGEVLKISCAPSHIILFIRDKSTKIIELKSVGNGSFGKLGTNSENDDNFYSPAPIDISLNIPEKNLSKQIKVVCSRYMSAILEITSPSNATFQSNLWVFGLCFKYLFSSRDLENLKNSKKKYMYVDTNMCVQPKPIKISSWENVKKVALSDTAIYIISNKDEIKFNGMFFSQRKDNISEKKINVRGQFKSISIGIDHAAGITLKNYIFTWGYNFMNKLGVIESNDNLEKLNLDLDFENNIAAFFHKEPENITEINKFFEIPDNKALKEEILPAETKDDQREEEKTDKINDEHNQDDYDNIFFQCQQKVKHKYEEIENQIIRAEQNFKESIIKIMSNYNFLLQYEEETRNLKKVLYNQVNFRMIEPPLSIELKKEKKGKYPQEFYDYRKNYKSLLTTLRLHPCYITKMYENKLMGDKDLYVVIKQLFSNINNDKYSKILLLTIAKMIFERDLRSQKDKIKNENEKINKDKTKKLDILEEYKLINVEKDSEINLFGKLFKLIFKSEFEENIQKSDAVAAIVVNHIYKLVGSKLGHGEMEKAMYIFAPPNEKVSDEISYTASALNGKLEYVFNIINVIFELMNLLSSDETIIAKEYVYNLNKDVYNNKLSENSDKNMFISYGKITKILLKEMYSSIKKITEIKDLEKIDDWMGKNLGLLLFRKLIKTLTNPNSLLLINANIAIDRTSYKSFMERCKFNFYTVSFTFEHILKSLLASEDKQIGGEEEAFKKINKKLSDNRSFYLGKLKNLVSRSESEEKNQRTDILSLEQFFIHSLNEKVYPINFSLFLLKKLHVTIVANIDKIRVLNKGFDLMDVIFFNTNPEYFLGMTKGLATFNISADNTLIIQQKLKTRSLAFENPKNINRCTICRTVILKEFNYSNEETFFDECQLYMKNSKHGYVIQILKDMKNISSDNIIDHFKVELKNPNNKIKDNLFQLLAIFAYEKKDLMLEDDDLKHETKLFAIMFNDKTVKTKFSEISKEILEKFKEMEDHRQYQTQLDQSLMNISKYVTKNQDEKFVKNLDMINDSMNINEITKKNKSDQFFNLELFKRIQKNFEKGYGNPDLEKHADSLESNAMLVNLIKSIANMPRSKNLFEKLSVNKKSKLLPFREYSLKNLFDNNVIIRVLVKTGEYNLLEV